MELFGRDSELATIINTESPLLLLTGDSGIGKSVLLAAAAESLRGDALVALPTLLGSSPGSLQRAILNQLAECLTDFIRSRHGTPNAVWEAMRGAATRVGSISGKQIARVAATEILALVKGRLGEEFGAAMVGLGQELFTAEDKSLSNRLKTASDPDIVKTLLSLAAEVSAFVEQQIVIILDRVEELSDSESGILSDLAEWTSDDVRFVVGINDAFNDTRDRILRLVRRGADLLPIRALTDDALTGWLTSANIPRNLWPHIARSSSSYPFFVKEAIDAVLRGDRIDRLVNETGFEALLQSRWVALGSETRRVAMRLAVFPDRPDESELLRILDMDALDWAIREQDLKHSNMFVPQGEGGLWFHDRRRQYIWHSAMTTTSRNAVASSALKALELADWSSVEGIPGWFISSLPVIASALQSDARPEGIAGQLARISALSDGELAILFALIEISEEGGTDNIRFAETSRAVSYAGRVLGVDEDPVQSLGNLHKAGFVYTSENAVTSIATIIMPSTFAHAAVVGRMAEVFGRWPIPRLASVVFDAVLRPLLDDFELAVVGLGKAGPSHFTTTVREAVNDPESTVEKDMPALGFDGRLGPRDFHGTFIFKSAEDRDAAKLRLDNLVATVFGEDFSAVETIELPIARLPSRRFALLSGRAASMQRPPAASQTEYYRQCQERVHALSSLRGRMNAIERSVAKLTEEQSLLVVASDGRSDGSTPWVVELRLSGKIPSFRALSHWDQGLFHDPHLELKLRGEGVIRHDEQIIGKEYKSGPLDGRSGFNTAVDAITERLENFNKKLPSVNVPFDAESIARLVDDFHSLHVNDIRTLIGAGISVPADLAHAERRMARIALGKASLDLGMRSYVASVCYSDDGPGNQVQTVDEDFTHSPESLAALWGLTEEPPRVHFAMAEYVLAPLMGYAPEDIQLDPRPLWLESN